MLYRSVNESFHLVDKLAEELESGVDGGGAAHVNTRYLQQADRIGAAAAGEELLIVRDRGRALGQNAVRNCDRGGEAVAYWNT